MRSAGAIAIVTALLVSAAPARGASLPNDMQALVNAGAPGVIVFARNGTRSLRLAASQQGHPQIEPHSGIPAAQTHGASQVAGGAGKVALLEQEQAQVFVRGQQASIQL